MPNWYAGRRAVKRAGGINGDERDAQIDRLIAAASEGIRVRTRRYFIPRTETRLYPWPQRRPGRAWILWLDQDLISVTTLQTKAQDASPTTIAATDYFLEPVNTGPPYNRIEIDLSSTAAFEAGATPQRSISVLGSWGFRADTLDAGTVSSGLASDATATTFVASDSSLIDVGDTLLIESEQVFVSDVVNAALDSILLDMVGNLAADKSVVTVTVDTGHGIVAGEVIMIDSERMYVESVSGNDLTVVRAYDGSVLASHNDNTAIHIFRTFTIVRGINGTTAAVHANATAISKYDPPADIVQLAIAETLAAFHMEHAGWGRTVGQGDAQREWGGQVLGKMQEAVMRRYKRLREAVI